MVTMRKTGKFYSVYEDGAYVMNALMGYQISNGRVGFPCEVLNKVLNKLEECKVSYQVIDKSLSGEKKIFPKSNYAKFLRIGMKNSQIRMKEQDLIERVRNLSPEKLDKIISYIEDVLYEDG